MHVRFVLRQVGLLLFVFSGAMLFPALWSLSNIMLFDATGGETEALIALLVSILFGTITGGALYLAGNAGSGVLGRREALLLVALSWVVGAALGAAPFRIWAALHDFEAHAADPAFRSFVNCYFEAMSGLTTTGATILNDIPTIPDGLIMWRAMTHWLGGLGIVVLFVAVLPMLGVGGKRLFRIETTGVTSEGVTPKIRESARALWVIYMTLTLAQILLLKVVDTSLSWFECVTHTFATLATGGFSTLNESAGGLNPAVQWIMIWFMFLAGINFALYHQIMRGKPWTVWKDTELRVYIITIAVATLIISLNIYKADYTDMQRNVVNATGERVIRDALFQVVSIQTTTGFCTANFDEWGVLSKAVLLGLMFIGGCGGSTGGGIKVIRIVAAVKVMIGELERSFRPNVIRPIRIGNASIDDQQRLGILAYVLGIVVLFCFGTMLLMVLEQHRTDGVTAATAVIATLNNIGPGLRGVGATANYSWFTDSSKLLMCLLMAVGRLEVFAVLSLFMPRFWRTQ